MESSIKNISDSNPFNIAVVLGELVNRLAGKFNDQPARLYSETEVMFFIEEIILTLCNKTEEEMIKRKAMEYVVTHYFFSKN